MCICTHVNSIWIVYNFYQTSYYVSISLWLILLASRKAGCDVKMWFTWFVQNIYFTVAVYNSPARECYRILNKLMTKAGAEILQLKTGSYPKSKSLLPKWNTVWTMHISFTVTRFSVTCYLWVCSLTCFDMKLWWLQKIYYDEYCWEHSLSETVNIDVLWNKRWRNVSLSAVAQI